MKRSIVAAAAAVILPTMTFAAELKVLSTQATEDTYRELVPQFEKATGHKVATIFTGTLDAQKRLAAGENYDMIIMASPAIDAQIKANREVEVGFQQVSEVGNFPGVDYIGPLPADVQQMTVFSSGIVVDAKEAEPARTLVKFLTTPEAGAAFRKRGMEPG
jgi:ABC-type molybdate transport system substrate-binding protein